MKRASLSLQKRCNRNTMKKLMIKKGLIKSNKIKYSKKVYIISSIIMLLFVLIFSSCSEPILLEDDFWAVNTKKNFNSIKEISDYARCEVKYVYDWENPYYPKLVDFHQTPRETEIYMIGDCEDQCLFALALIYKNFKIKGSIQLVDSTGDGLWNHVQIKVEDKIYLINSPYYKVLDEIEFDDIPNSNWWSR